MNRAHKGVHTDYVPFIRLLGLYLALPYIDFALSVSTAARRLAQGNGFDCIGLEELELSESWEAWIPISLLVASSWVGLGCR